MTASGRRDESSGFHMANAYTGAVQRCPETSLYVGYVPGFQGAYSQGETLEELNENLKEVISMLLADDNPSIALHFGWMPF